MAAAEQLEPLGDRVRGGRFTALTPGWPDDPETVEEANAHPEVFAGKTVGQVADHYDEIIRGLDKKPAVIGHSFGGLLTQIIAGRGLSAVSVAIEVHLVDRNMLLSRRFGDNPRGSMNRGKTRIGISKQPGGRRTISLRRKNRHLDLHPGKK